MFEAIEGIEENLCYALETKGSIVHNNAYVYHVITLISIILLLIPDCIDYQPGAIVRIP